MPYKDPIKAREAREKWKKANVEKQRGYVKKSKAKHDAMLEARKSGG